MIRWLTSINQRLLFFFLLIAVLPVGFVGYLNVTNTQSLLGQEVEDRQLEVARLTTHQISDFVDQLVADLHTIGIVALKFPDENYAILDQLSDENTLYSKIQLINTDGQEVARIEAGRQVTASELVNVRSQEIFFRPMRDEAFFSSVRLAESVPYIDIAIPIKDNETILGVIVAQINLEDPWTIIKNQRIGDDGYTLLLDKRGNVIVYPQQDQSNRSLSYTNTSLISSLIQDPTQTSIVQYQSPLGKEVIGTATAINGPGWTLVTERPVSEAFSAYDQARTTALFGIAISILLAIPLAFILSRQITQPIRQLRNSAREIMSGNLNAVTTIIRRDEIGDLAQAFNQMTGQIRSLISTLEERIANRTRDLQIAAEVSREVTTVLNLETLLPTVVELTRNGFALYSVLIYLYEPETDMLTLAGTTNNDASLPHQLKLNSSQRSLVVKCAETRQVLNVPDVSHNPDYYAVASLPHTRSELVMPLLIGDELVGVIDLQSTEAHHFGEDERRVMTSLAEQLTIAIKNARQYADQVRLTDNLRAVDRMKSQFMASVSHELRTPLNAIINFTQFVVLGIYGEINHEQNDALSKSLESAEHLLSLINDVLDITKIEAGMMVLFVEPEVDMRKELETVVNTIQPLVSDKAVTINTDFAERLPVLMGDKRRLRQILLNLGSNAAKFTTEGEITLSAECKDDAILVSVRDTGPGIANEDYGLIFESFRQARGGLEHGSGTGLGLAISKRLAEAHQGQLWFESEVGKGSTFYLEVPLRSDTLELSLKRQSEGTK